MWATAGDGRTIARGEAKERDAERGHKAVFPRQAPPALDRGGVRKQAPSGGDIFGTASIVPGTIS